jgi:hypothetical protein
MRRASASVITWNALAIMMIADSGAMVTPAAATISMSTFTWPPLRAVSCTVAPVGTPSAPSICSPSSAAGFSGSSSV